MKKPKVKKAELPEVGAEVVLTSVHPWGGGSGDVVRHEYVGFLNRLCAVVDLGNGCSAGITDATEWEYAPGYSPHKA